MHGRHWLIPFIYEYAWDQYEAAWKKDNPRRRFTGIKFVPPIWAKRVDLNKLTFEHPLEV